MMSSDPVTNTTVSAKAVDQSNESTGGVLTPSDNESVEAEGTALESEFNERSAQWQAFKSVVLTQAKALFDEKGEDVDWRATPPNYELKMEVRKESTPAIPHEVEDAIISLRLEFGETIEQYLSRSHELMQRCDSVHRKLLFSRMIHNLPKSRHPSSFMIYRHVRCYLKAKGVMNKSHASLESWATWEDLAEAFNHYFEEEDQLLHLIQRMGSSDHSKPSDSHSVTVGPFCCEKAEPDKDLPLTKSTILWQPPATSVISPLPAPPGLATPEFNADEEINRQHSRLKAHLYEMDPLHSIEDKGSYAAGNGRSNLTAHGTGIDAMQEAVIARLDALIEKNIGKESKIGHRKATVPKLASPSSTTEPKKKN